MRATMYARLGVLFALCAGAQACSEAAPAEDAPETAAAPVDPDALPAPVERVDPATLTEVVAQLGVPPMAAPPTGRSSPARVSVTLEVREPEVGRRARRGPRYRAA